MQTMSRRTHTLLIRIRHRRFLVRRFAQSQIAHLHRATSGLCAQHTWFLVPRIFRRRRPLLCRRSPLGVFWRLHARPPRFPSLPSAECLERRRLALQFLLRLPSPRTEAQDYVVEKNPGPALPKSSGKKSCFERKVTCLERKDAVDDPPPLPPVTQASQATDASQRSEVRMERLTAEPISDWLALLPLLDQHGRVAATVKHKGRIVRWYFMRSQMQHSFHVADDRNRWKDTIPPEEYPGELLGAVPAPAENLPLSLSVALLPQRLREEFDQLEQLLDDETTQIYEAEQKAFNSVKRTFRQRLRDIDMRTKASATESQKRSREETTRGQDDDPQPRVRICDPYAPVTVPDFDASPDPAATISAIDGETDSYTPEAPFRRFRLWTKVPRYAEKHFAQAVLETWHKDGFQGLMSLPAQVLRKGSKRTVLRQIIRRTPDDAVPPPRLAPDRSDRDRLLRKTKELCADGHARRAAATLRRVPLPAAAPSAILEALKKLHPPGRSPLLPELRVPPVAIFADPETLIAIVRKHATGSSAGPSGWTFDLIAQVLKHAPEFADALAEIVSAILNGVETSTALFECILVAVGKTGKVVNGNLARELRPIAMGEVFVKLAELYALKIVCETGGLGLSSCQFGCGFPGGAERVVHELRKRVAAGQTLISFDCCNAFNTIDRSAIRAAAEKFPLFAALFNQEYSHPTRLLSQWGNLLSVSGVRQGSALSAALFCLALDPVLRDVRFLFPEVEIFAYMDDVTFSSPDIAILEKAATFFAERLRTIDLQINCDKSVVVSTTARPEMFPTDSIVQRFHFARAAKILGAPIGSPEDSKEILKGMFEKMNVVFDRLEEMISLEDLRPTAYSVLKNCAATKALYVTRVSDPEISAPFLRDFDDKCVSAFGKISGGHIQHDAERAFVCLPLGAGGAGITDLAPIAKDLYKASRDGTTSSPIRRLRDSVLAELVDSDPFLKRVRESNCLPHASRWLLECCAFDWPHGSFAGALRQRCSLIPAEFCEGDEGRATYDCPWCHSVFTRAEWPQHVTFCHSAKGSASRNRKHRAIGDSMARELASSGGSLAVRLEPREYASQRCMRCKRSFTTELEHVGCPGRTTRSGPDISIEQPWRTDVLDFTVVHSCSQANTHKTYPVLAKEVSEKKNAKYLSHALARGEAFACVPIFASTGILKETFTTLAQIFAGSDVDVPHMALACQVAVARGNGLANSAAKELTVKQDRN